MFRHDYCKPKSYSDNPYIRMEQERSDKKYPYFEITDGVVNRTFNFYIALAEEASNVLSTKNAFNIGDFKNLVIQLYSKYCK